MAGNEGRANGQVKYKNGKRVRRRLVMTGTKLKIYGYITMLFYTVGMTVIRCGLLNANAYTEEGLAELLRESSDKMMLAGWASVFQLVGGLAVPVFAFLLVEGFVHTGSFRKYLLTMLIFAVLSEVPYDFAMQQTFFDITAQNPMFTLAVCLIMLYGLRLFEGKKGAACRLAQGMIVLAALLWCSLCHLNFGLCMVLLTAVYYLLYERKGIRILLGCLISLLYVTGPVSGYVLWNYSGDRGWNGNKYLFYVAYPVHLLIMGGITCLLSGR